MRSGFSSGKTHSLIAALQTLLATEPDRTRRVLVPDRDVEFYKESLPGYEVISHSEMKAAEPPEAPNVFIDEFKEKRTLSRRYNRRRWPRPR